MSQITDLRNQRGWQPIYFASGKTILAKVSPLGLFDRGTERRICDYEIKVTILETSILGFLS